MSCNFKVKIKDIQNKYKFKIFCAGKSYDDSEIKEEIEALEEELTDTKEEVERANLVYNALPKVEGTGESITLNDTANAPLKLDLKGNTYQDSTSGNTMTDTTNYSVEESGVSITSEPNGILTLNGTASANINKSYSSIIPQTYNIPSGTYYVHYKYISGTLTGRLVTNLRGTGDTTSNQIDVNENAYPTDKYVEKVIRTDATITTAQIMISSGAVLNNLKIQIWWSKSTATDYEEYTNGASPNPDYPQEIEVVTGENEVEVCSKNLFDESTTTNVLINDTGVENPNSNVHTSRYIKVNPNKEYTFSCEILEGQSAGWQKISYYDKNKTYLSFIYFTNQTRTITLPTNCEYLRIGYHINYVKNIQFEQGSTATTYEPYKGQTYEVNLGSIKLCKIETYQDRIYKNNGNWYLHKEIGKVVLTGGENENWNRTVTNNIARFELSGIDYLKGNSYVADLPTFLSNNFTKQLFNDIANGVETGISWWWASWSSSLKLLIIGFQDSRSLQDFKTWLSTHNTIVYYPLETPTDTQITDTTLISQLNALEKALAYQNQTNISQTNADKPFIIDASTIYDLSNLVTRVAVLETE